MTSDWDAYEAAMEATNSFNWDPPLFVRHVREEIYCWRCNRALNANEFYYCSDCGQECWAYWGA
jgi:hypothetical protein